MPQAAFLKASNLHRCQATLTHPHTRAEHGGTAEFLLGSDRHR